MKPRHAAALALVGWYLVAPSDNWVHDAGGDAVLSAQWYKLGVFETEAQCDKALQNVKARVDAAYEKERRSGHKLKFQMGDGAECDDGPSQMNLPTFDSSNPVSPRIKGFEHSD